ncbi:hypothetical protein ACVIW3_003870 [Bradyrhizobium diazoefficiens]
MAIDGTWRRDCKLNAISDTDAILTVEGSIQGLNLKEFFLLLSSTGLAYRRCELVRVNGAEMDIQFLRGKNPQEARRRRRPRRGSLTGAWRRRRFPPRCFTFAETSGRICRGGFTWPKRAPCIHCLSQSQEYGNAQKFPLPRPIEPARRRRAACAPAPGGR